MVSRAQSTSTIALLAGFILIYPNAERPQTWYSPNDVINQSRADPKKVALYDCDKSKTNDLLSLACTIYFESRGVDIVDQLLVAKTVINRVGLTGFPSSIHEVAWQSRLVTSKQPTGDVQKTVYQYSWISVNPDHNVYDSESWERAQIIAQLEMLEKQKKIAIDLTIQKTPAAAQFPAITHYFDKTMKKPPYWAVLKHKPIQPMIKTASLSFFNHNQIPKKKPKHS